MIITGNNKEITRIMTGDGREIIEVRDTNGNIVYQTAIEMTGDPPLYFQGKGKPLKDYSIWGNSYQNGIPDPDNPVEVVSCGDKTKNLYDKNAKNTNNGFALNSYVNMGGGLNTAIGYQTSEYIPISPGKYYAQNLPHLAVGGIAFYDSTKTFISAKQSEIHFDFDAPEGSRYIRLSVTNPSETMLIAGAHDSEYPLEYIPYGYKIPVTISDGTNSQTTNIYLSEPLRKSPTNTVFDELNFKNGVVIRKRKAGVVQGTRLYIRGSESACFAIGGLSGATTAYGYSATGILCDKLKPYSNRYVAYNFDSISYGWNGVFTCTLKFSTIGATEESTDSELENLATLFFANNHVTVEYDLATPTTEPITLPTIPTINGQNVLSIGTTLQPSTVSITGHIKPSSG